MPTDESLVRVAVRVRPFNTREKELGHEESPCFKVTGSMIEIAKQDVPAKRFTFDFCYNSFVDASHPDYASQDTVWDDLGTSVLDSAWEGGATTQCTRNAPH
jgi:hypothetical protein